MKMKVSKSILREFIKFCLANKVKPGYYNHIDRIVRYEPDDKSGLVFINKDMVKWICSWYDSFAIWKYGNSVTVKPDFYRVLRNLL